MTKRYKLTFCVPKWGNGKETLFHSTVEAEDTDDIQGIKEDRAMDFERRLKTPVVCVEIEKIE